MSGSSPGRFLVAGLLAGTLAGTGAGLVGLIAAEPQLDRAIEIESGSAGHHGAPPPAQGRFEVSRVVQRAGMVLATALYGLAVGGLAALALLSMRGRTAHRSDRTLALTVVAAMFVAAVAVPFAKYPASPPGVGDPATIGERTELYLVTVAGSLAALLAGWRVARLLSGRRPWQRSLAFWLTFGALATGLALSLPGASQVPGGYPDEVLRDFRLASLGLQLTLWSALAVSFATMLARLGRHGSRAGRHRG